MLKERFHKRAHSGREACAYQKSEYELNENGVKETFAKRKSVEILIKRYGGQIFCPFFRSAMTLEDVRFASLKFIYHYAKCRSLPIRVGEL